jgi:monofunctional glycosyltransferase
MAKQVKRKSSPFRRWIKRIVAVSLCIQIIFLVYFFFKVSAHTPNGNSLRIKSIIVLLLMSGLIFLYFKRLRKYPKIKRLVNAVLRYVLILHAAMLVYIFLLKWINPPVTITQLSNWVSGYGLKRDYVSSDDISSNARLAVIASEDQLFTDHNGFDWNAIEKSFKPKKGKKKKTPPGAGASTISQQVAKNVFLWQGKSDIRKGLEAYFTFMIEQVWGKERILNVYLNVIEMGKGVFGIEAAAQYYFNKPAKDLSRREAAMIAACFPNPKQYTVKPVSPYVSIKSNWILQQMNNIEDDEDVQRVIR